MSNTNLRYLREARELLADPERWTQEAFARNHLHWQVDAGSENACCFCAIGALHRVTRVHTVEAADANYYVLRRILADAVRASKLSETEQRYKCDGTLIVAWNDAPGRKHEEVLAVFDKAIANLEARA